MAKMHSRARGKSGSRKPAKKTKPTWLSYDAKTVEQLVVKLAKSGKPAAEVGLILRDSYGIPDVKVVTKKNIGKILKENKLESKLPEDVKSLIRKAILIMKHVDVNKKDMAAKRGLILTESKIKRLSKYYKRIERLPVDWNYNRTNAKVLVEA